MDPYLYELVTTVTAGDAEDVLRTRFGFREFEVRGPDFYLNGKKISLLATSWWPSVQPETDEAIRQKIRFIKSANCVAFRTHTQPWRERWYDIADEEGLLMIPEGAVWNDDAFYALDDDRWWDNCALHLTRMVDRDKNRPSVVMWSLENEFYGGRMVDDTPYEERLAEMGRIVKRHDPTRPIMYESDGDPGGVADVIGIHYPHEYPEFTNWPNEADWLENPIKMGHAFTETPGTFEWKKDKPLYIGEFLWIPSSNPNWDTVWFGDEAYRDYRKYHVLAKAESWKQQVIGYRRHGVAGISPWTVVEGGGLDDDNPLVQAHRYAYQPIAAYPREMYRRVFGGTATRIAFDVLNDSFADRNLTLRHGTKLAGAQPEWQEGRANAMGSGDRMSFLNSLMWPVVDQRTEGAYVVQVLEDGEVVFLEEHTVSVFPDMPPQASAPDGVRVGECHAPDDGPLIVDGATRVEGLHDLPDGLAVLVIAPGALGAEEAERSVIGRRVGTTGLPDWVAAGGRAVVLEQQQYPTGTLPAALSEHSSTMTFAQIPAHPLLRGVNSEDLKHWGARTMLENEQSLMILETPHQVTEAEPARHVAGACIPVVVSGSSGGVTHAPLMVVPHGDGAYILCQMAVLDKYRREPAAAILLQNIIDHALNYPGNGKPTALQCEIDSVRQKLDEVRAKTDDLATLRGERDLAQYGALIYASTNADGLMDDGLWEWIEAGGNVLVHGLEPSEYEKLAERLDPTLRMVEYEGPALRATGDDALLYSFTNEDLYWLGEHTGISWSTTPLSTKAARTAFERRVDPAEASAYDATGLELEGKYVGVGETGDHVYFATIGTGKMKIDFPEDGEYVIGIEARGTPAQGAFPLAAVRLDGEPVGTLSIRGEEWDSYATDHTATAGEHEFEVAFINDGSGPGEDRNMYVKT
ncbi:MAG TPA: glycoside hydrolase family 2 TIM barrel-domain containing protein, partial [Armatimonadota bacterium]|nr:glycoside hydrolase family 2 TIM barrel-domain containing protein [Armatimonadota bacterium]